MKMSKAVHFISQFFFWFICIMFYTWFFTLEDAMWKLLLVTLFTVAACNFARMPRNKTLMFIAHLLTAAVPGIFGATDVISILSMVFMMGVIVLSLIVGLSASRYMDRAHGFGGFVLIVLYLIGSVMEYKYIWLGFAGVAVYFFLIIIQNNFEKNEEYVEGISHSSNVDINKTQILPNLFTLITGLFIVLVCTGIAFIGRIPFIAGISGMIQGRLKDVLGFLRRVSVDMPQKEYGTEPPSGSADGMGQIPVAENIENTLADKIISAILVILVIAVVIFGIYLGIKQLYQYYLKLYRMGLVDEEEVTLNKASDGKKKKVNPRDLDKSYSNRKALRRIYKKRIKGKSGRREDFNNKTPYEQREKSLSEGNAVSTEFVDMYEKARYSPGEVTREDVKKMSKMK